MSFEELVGQKLVVGIQGTQLNPETVHLLRKTHAGGLIFFHRNFESAEKLRRFIADLERILGKRLLILVDHEGGRVIRFREGVTIFPDAQAVGNSGRADWVQRQGEIEAGELRYLGVDVNLAPVLDILGRSWNPAIGTRSYGNDPELVATLGRARIEGMQSKGLSACAKHYPGLGEATLDPHQTLPTLPGDWNQLKRTSLIPFLQAFEARVDCVMSSHVLYPEIDRKPVTFSRRIVHDFLRLELGYPGVLLTDDLKMDAVTKKVSLREAAFLATQAGHDLLLVCSDPHAQLEIFDALVWSYKKKELRISELEASIERIQHLISKRSERFSIETKTSFEEGKKIAQRLAREGAQALSTGREILPLSPAWCLRHSLLGIFPDLSLLASEFVIEPELLNPHHFLKTLFSLFGVSLGRVEIIPLRPSVIERDRIKGVAQSADLIFFFCWDAHLFKEQRELLEALQELRNRLVVILLREPQDFEWIRTDTACVTAYGFRVCQAEAAVEKVFS